MSAEYQYDGLSGTWVLKDTTPWGGHTAMQEYMADQEALAEYEHAAAAKKRGRRQTRREAAAAMRRDYPQAWGAIQRGETPTPAMFSDSPAATDTIDDAKRKQRNRRRKKRQRAAMAIAMDDEARTMQLMVIGGVGAVFVGIIAFVAYKWA